MNCNATAMLKIHSVYKQSKKYHPQVYVKGCKYTVAESQQCNMLSDDIMMDLLRCKKNA